MAAEVVALAIALLAWLATTLAWSRWRRRITAELRAIRRLLER